MTKAKKTKPRPKVSTHKVTVADLNHLRSWVHDACDDHNRKDLRASHTLDRLIYAASILAAEIDSSMMDADDESESDQKTLDEAMEVGRLAAEVPTDY